MTLKSYTQLGIQSINDFRTETKKIFRKNFIDFFSNKSKSDFEFFVYEGGDRKDFIERNFRTLNGKCFITSDNKLLLAIHKSDSSLAGFKPLFIPFEFK